MCEDYMRPHPHGHRISPLGWIAAKYQRLHPGFLYFPTKKHNKEINMLRKCQILIFCIYSLSYIYNCVQISILKNFYEFRTGFLYDCNTFRLKIFQLFYCWVQLMIWEDLTLTFLLVNSDVCAINLINLRTTTMKLWRSIQLSIKIDAFLILLTLIKGFLQAHLSQSYLGWLEWIIGKTKHWLIVALLSNSTPFPAFQASGNSSHLAPRWRLSASLAPALCQMIAISISVRRDIGWHRTQAVVLLQL